MSKPLSQLKREGVEFLAILHDKSAFAQKDFAAKLIAEARDYGLNMRDYLRAKIDPKSGEAKFDGLNGYEAALAYLGLPVRDDLDSGVSLQAAADTFQTFPGTRALFPTVMDDVVQWKYKQDQIEKVEPLLANSRTVSGTELLTTVVDDSADDYKVMQEIAEGTRVHIYSIRSSEHSVRFFKHGMGYRTTYEFERRARLDLMVPYANRALRQAEISKVSYATNMLVNGDAVHAAAPVIAQTIYDGTPGFTDATNGKISFTHLLSWLVDRAKAGFPIDTVVGNWDAYIQWLMMFALPTSNNSRTDAENLAAMGYQIGGVPLLNGTVNFVISSTGPASKLIGYSRGDTLEELVESGSLINESERSIENQTITYVRTENTGYRIVFDGTRSIFDFGN